MACNKPLSNFTDTDKQCLNKLAPSLIPNHPLTTENYPEHLIELAGQNCQRVCFVARCVTLQKKEWIKLCKIVWWTFVLPILTSTDMSSWLKHNWGPAGLKSFTLQKCKCSETWLNPDVCTTQQHRYHGQLDRFWRKVQNFNKSKNWSFYLILSDSTNNTLSTQTKLFVREFSTQNGIYIYWVSSTIHWGKVVNLTFRPQVSVCTGCVYSKTNVHRIIYADLVNCSKIITAQYKYGRWLWISVCS